MENQNTINEQTLLDYFSGTLPTEYIHTVEEWINASEENLKIARDIQYIYRATDTLQTINKISSTKAFVKVKKKMNKTKETHFLFWFRRIAAILVLPLLVSTLFLANKKEPIEEIEIRTNPGMIAKIKLPDGSLVWLNSQSYMKYPRKFKGDIREVEIDGEAYFSIQKNKSKRFIVNTPFDLKAEVLGTEFNIEAYKNSKQVTTTLVSGSVKLSFQGKSNKRESITMKPNDKIAYHAWSKKILAEKSSVPTDTAWKDGLIIFRDTPLEEALKILSKRFNAEFIVKNTHLYDNSYTGTFDAQHLDLVLEHFRISTDIQYKFIHPKGGEDRIYQKTIVELY